MARTEGPILGPCEAGRQYPLLNHLPHSPSHDVDEDRLKSRPANGTSQETVLQLSQTSVGGQATNEVSKAEEEGRSIPIGSDHAQGWDPGVSHRSSVAAPGIRLTTLETYKRRQSQVDKMAAQGFEKANTLKHPPTTKYEVTSSPCSPPARIVLSRPHSSERLQRVLSVLPETFSSRSEASAGDSNTQSPRTTQCGETSQAAHRILVDGLQDSPLVNAEPATGPEKAVNSALRPIPGVRSISTPSAVNQSHTTKVPNNAGHAVSQSNEERGTAFDFDTSELKFDPATAETALPSPLPASIPIPPLSIPTYLQLELSSHRPSPLYIHKLANSDFPYESSHVKIERLLNFIFLPLHLEGVLWYGTLACFDAWLYTLTILPLRLLKSFYILGQSWTTNLMLEIRFLSGFVYRGTGRVWRRRQSRRFSASEMGPDGCTHSSSQGSDQILATSLTSPRSQRSNSRIDASVLRHESTHSSSAQWRHRRAKSVPSALLPDDKADILKGLLIICTCVILMRFDASRMYHWIRGQAAIKLYVIYNVLEVCDRLFAAIGQDVLECLFSQEALERRPDGHSKILRPFWLFLVAMIYTVVHATSLFYQVITLNVAVNSYSNALITLLMSNQFVEIKSAVFKKFEKENLFQMTCADVVERFQLWLMLTIIASRNIVETGGFSRGFSALGAPLSILTTTSTSNNSNLLTQAMPPRSSSSILPRSFELVPALFTSVSAYAPTIGHIFGPFLVVLGSEMLVDWLKHAYINKFNNTRPTIYGRFLDVLAKDYYSNAFGDPNLTKRLGLPVIPLSCLFIRASVQTYQMFLAAWIPIPRPSSATALTDIPGDYTASASSLSTSTAVALSQKLDDLLRRIPPSISSLAIYRHFTTILVALVLFLVLLAIKIVLGMVLLSYSRSRYRSMKEREKDSVHEIKGGKRVGGWGVVEVDEDKRRWIYEDDNEGLKALKERELRARVKKEKGAGEMAFDKVKRYEMVAKRIW